MKKIFIAMLTLSAGAFFNAAGAQDLCSSNPKYCKVLADTAGVKMMLVTLPPGARLVTHTHPIQMGHVIKGGLYQWTFDDKKTESFQMEPGASFHGGAEGPHHSWNGGNTTIQFVFVEKRD